MKNLAKVGTIAAILAALALAGCGGAKQDQTKTAAACLRNALASDSLGEKGNNCGDASAYQAMQQTDSSMRFTAACTHQNANQYICDVTGPATTGLDQVKGGFYAVTFDGASIVYQPTEGNS